ncbi:MAG: hypothetical protein GOU97_04260 [Nanoarchaeota archaeon]|nr:hypothetical protein [Nanoarchaeota archaeon]
MILTIRKITLTMMNLKLSKTEIAIIVIALVTSPLISIVADIHSIGVVLFMEGFYVIFFALFGYAVMFYGYGKRGERAYSWKTMEQVRKILPRLLMVFTPITIIGFILMLMWI